MAAIGDLTTRLYTRTGLDRLPAHLGDRYGVEVRSVQPLDTATLRVERDDGPPWVARVFPPARPVEQVEGDAAILRFLEERDYPSERCADPAPVSIHDGQAVLVTRFVPGAKAGTDGATLHRLGELLGRLHCLTGGAAATGREAGSLHHWAPGDGGPQEDLTAAASWLAELDADIPELRERLATADVGADLPRALVHPDFQPENAIVTDTGPVIVDWTGAGTGPRAASLAVLLHLAVTRGGGLDAVGPVMAGYRTRVTPEPAELDRLAGLIRLRPLVFACFLLCLKLKDRAGTLSDLEATDRLAGEIAARARA